MVISLGELISTLTGTCAPLEARFGPESFTKSASTIMKKFYIFIEYDTHKF